MSKTDGRFERIPLEERFWKRVKRSDGCWEWTGERTQWGYGTLRLYFKQDDGTERKPHMGAHRLSWAIAHGDPGELCVLHRCDNPPCVRPDHLFLGTDGDNIRDCVKKGRFDRTAAALAISGERSHLAKLTNAQAVEIKRRRASGESLSALGREFGVTKQAIWAMTNGRSWNRVALQL